VAHDGIADLATATIDQIQHAGRQAALVEDLDDESALNGVSVAGLNTTVLPETRAGAIFQIGIAMGKFHGVMIPTGPTGCLSV